MARRITNTYLHLGIHKDKLGRLDEPLPLPAGYGTGDLTIAKVLSPIPPYLDGDGWNSWGEKPGTDVNDEVTMHVMFHVPEWLTPRPFVQALDNEGLLTPMADQYVAPGTEHLVQSDIVAVLTSATVWSEGVVVFYRKPDKQIEIAVR